MGAFDFGQNEVLKNPMFALIGGTILLICGVMLIFLLVVRKTRMNWYERNLLEIAESQPKYIRYQKMQTFDSMADIEDSDNLPLSEDECSAESFAPRSCLHKQQSRLYKEPNGHHLTASHAAIVGDFSEKFCVPKSPSSNTISMYKELTASQFDRELYDSRQDSTASEDQVLGECGSLKMALSFDQNLSLLTVQLRQAANLMAQQPEELPNPYFKVTLHKAEPSSHAHTQQSRVYRQTRSPEASDEFFFDVPLGQLHSCKLEVMVFDFDQCSVDECIGYCWLSLNRIEVSVEMEKPSVFWAEVMPVQINEDNFGEILFSIAHLTKAQRLNVSIFKARKLIQPEDFAQLPDPMVRVEVSCNGRKLKRKHTTSKKSTLNPIFNEILTFNLPKSFTLADITINMEVIHGGGSIWGSGSHPRVIGTLTLPLSKCKDLWKAFIKGENSQARWYALDRQQ